MAFVEGLFCTQTVHLGPGLSFRDSGVPNIILINKINDAYFPQDRVMVRCVCGVSPHRIA